MILITDELRARLLANGAAGVETDHVPVVKLFDPSRAATGLSPNCMPTAIRCSASAISVLDFLNSAAPALPNLKASGDRSVSVSDCDLHFEARFPLSVYAEAARIAGHITEAERLLRQAADALSTPHSELPPDAAGERR